MIAKYSPFYLTMLLAVFLISCDDTAEEVSYEIPGTYNFENVDYSGQETRIAMLAELSALAKSSNSGEIVLAADLQAMYENAGSPFNDATLNSADKDLKSKTFELDQSMIESYFVKLEEATKAAASEGSNGVPGLVTSLDGTKTYFFDANGYEYAQLIEKDIMGACFYYQALGVYLSSEKIGDAVDNETVVPGEGTDMEHHWDEAFGYSSLPKDYPSNTADLGFWAKYIHGREEVLSVGSRLMSAFIKGRAAISANDMATKEEAILEVSKEFELVVASTAIHYINSALNAYQDDAIRNHTLSEAWSFVNALQYNPNKTLSTAEVLEVRALLGDNFYTVSRADLQAAKAKLVDAFDLTTEADIL